MKTLYLSNQVNKVQMYHNVTNNVTLPLFSTDSTKFLLTQILEILMVNKLL